MFGQLQIGDYLDDEPQLTTDSQGESYSVRYRQRIPEVDIIYTDRREAEIPQHQSSTRKTAGTAETPARLDKPLL